MFFQSNRDIFGSNPTFHGYGACSAGLKALLKARGSHVLLFMIVLTNLSNLMLLNNTPTLTLSSTTLDPTSH
eukprot:5586642-Amphidinium_carterae.1